MTATASATGGEGMEVSPELEEAANGSSGNIISLRSASNPAEPERVPAFKINGKVYTIRTKAKTNEGLRYVNIARTQGTRIAVDYMMERLLGDGWQALMDFDDLTDEDLARVIAAASKIMAGPLETPKGKQKSASSKSRG